MLSIQSLLPLPLISQIFPCKKKLSLYIPTMWIFFAMKVYIPFPPSCMIINHDHHNLQVIYSNNGLATVVVVMSTWHLILKMYELCGKNLNCMSLETYLDIRTNVDVFLQSPLYHFVHQLNYLLEMLWSFIDHILVFIRAFFFINNSNKFLKTLIQNLFKKQSLYGKVM